MKKPPIGIDMDGVICCPPLGLNLPIAPGPYRTSHQPSSKRTSSSRAGLIALKVLLRLKYYGRKPLPDALSGIREISKYRTPILVTSRNGHGSDIILSWLKANGFLEFFNDVHSNNLGLPSPDFKWRICSELGIEEFVDDDGRVADLLSRNGLARVFLRDWPRNRGYDYSENVIRVNSIPDIVHHLKAE